MAKVPSGVSFMQHDPVGVLGHIISDSDSDLFPLEMAYMEKVTALPKTCVMFVKEINSHSLHPADWYFFLTEKLSIQSF